MFVLVPHGVRACDGNATLENYNIAAANYTPTASPDGMPAPLPALSAYTFAAEFIARKSTNTLVDSVLFREGASCEGGSPSRAYAIVPDFLGLGVGTTLPSGAYSAESGRWVPEADGRVWAITNSGGTVSLDSAPPPGVSSSELAAIHTALFPSGCGAGLPSTRNMWLVPLPHFSAWDFNLAQIIALINRVIGPQNGARSENGTQCSMPRGGSIIECENRTLGERVAVQGTPFTLNYSTTRVPGFGSARRITLPLMDPMVNGASGRPERVHVEIQVAGQRVRWSATGVEAQQQKEFQFDWDGRDLEGRIVQGVQRAYVRLGYEYSANYAVPVESAGSSFGNPPSESATTVTTRNPGISWTERTVMLGVWDARAQHLGGWTLDAHHAYDPVSRRIHLGDGTSADAEPIGPAIESFAGSGGTCDGPGAGDGATPAAASLCGVNDVAVGRTGEVFFSTSHARRIRRVRAGETFLGSAVSFEALDADVSSLALDALGNLYAYAKRSSQASGAIYRFTREQLSGTMVTASDQHMVAGNGMLPDGMSIRGPAGSVPISVTSMAVDLDGSVLFTEHRGIAPAVSRVRRLLQRRGASGGLEWYIDHVVGGNTAANGESCSTGCNLRDLRFSEVAGVAVAPDGTLYVSDRGANKIFRLESHGRAHVALHGESCSVQLPTTDTADVACGPGRMVIDREGGLIFSVQNVYQLRRLGPDGRVTHTAGVFGVSCGQDDGCGSNGLARNAALGGLVTGLAAAPDGGVFVVAGTKRVRRIVPHHPSYLPRSTNGAPAITVPSADGALHYVFDHRGQHLQTRLAQTNALLAEFRYEADQLTSIRDHLDRVLLSIYHMPTGAVLTAPSSLQTTLTFDSSDWLTGIAHPDSGLHTMTYHNSWGLLASFNPPESLGIPTRFSYDTLGLLSTDTDPAGRTVRLERVSGGTEVGSRTIRITTTASQSTTTATEVEITRDPSGGDRRVVHELPTDRVGMTRVGSATVGPYRATPPGEIEVFVPAGEVLRSDEHGGTHRTTLGTATGLDGGVAPAGFSSQVFPVAETIARSEGDASVALQVNRVREIVPADGGPYDPPERIVDQVTTYPTVLGPDAGRTWRVSNDAVRDAGVLVGRELTVTSPAGRVQRVETDLLGRVVSTRDGNRSGTNAFHPVTVTYLHESSTLEDSVTVRQGTSREVVSNPNHTARTHKLSGEAVPSVYSVATITTAPSRHRTSSTVGGVTTSVTLDREGRVSRVAVPVEPSATTSPAHDYHYTSFGALRQYAPPPSVLDETDDWEWTPDRQPSRWLAPTPLTTAMGRHDVRYSYDRYRLPDQVWRVDVGAPTDPVLDYDFGTDGRLQSVSHWNPWTPGSGRVISDFLRYHGALVLSERTQIPGVFVATVERGLDEWGRIASTAVRDADGYIRDSVSSSYDQDGVLASTGALTFTPLRVSPGGALDADGRIESSELAAGLPSTVALRTRYEYDPGFGEPRAVETLRVAGSVQLHREEIQTRDPAGRILTMHEQWAEGATQRSCQNTYVYASSSGRLQSHTLDCDGSDLDDSVTFSYDANGNRTGAAHPTWNATAGQHSPRDQINGSFGPIAYLWSPRGSVTRRAYGSSFIEYDYDLGGALVEVRQKVGASVRRIIRYRNDAFGRRVARSTVDCPAATGCGSEVLRSVYIWDGPLRIIGELRYPSGVSSVPVRYRYVYATHANVPDYVMQDGNVRYRLVHDHLGSLRFAYDATTTGTEGRHLSRRYDVLGAVVDEVVSGADLPFGFAGGLYDREAGFVDDAGAPVLVHGRSAALVRFGARDYDPFAGRWMAPDPIHFAGGDSNLHGYCAGDPVNIFDHNGRQPRRVIGAMWRYATNALARELWGSTGFRADEFEVESGVGGDPDRTRVHVFNSLVALGTEARTIGDYCFYSRNHYNAGNRQHESIHTEQHQVLGPTYAPLQLAAMVYSTAHSALEDLYRKATGQAALEGWRNRWYARHNYFEQSAYDGVPWR